MIINYNVSALIASNALFHNDKQLSESIGKLTSGYKINHAKDNPSGLAMAKRMNAQIQCMKVADDSTNDGINIIKTADGVLGELQDMLQRMNELAIKAANGTNTEDDRETIQREITQLKSEVTRIADATQFNGRNLLDGTFDYRTYTTVGVTTVGGTTVSWVTDPKVEVSYYSDEMRSGKYTIEMPQANYNESGNRLENVTVGAPVIVTGAYGVIPDMIVKSYDGDIIKIANDKGQEIDVKADRDITAGELVEVDLTGICAMSIQVGANEGQLLDVRIPRISLSTLGIYNTNVTKERDPAAVAAGKLNSQQASQMAIAEVKNAIHEISNIRSRLGAYQNRMEHTDSNLNSTGENMTASYSRLMDLDMAEEMTNYSTLQVLTQAGISILSQANERPAQALQLLQN
jgi:flagellin fliC3